MDIYGIENITENDISYNYDKKHREIAIKLKNAKSQDEICEIKKVARREYNNMLKNVRINMNTLKDNFLNLLISILFTIIPKIVAPHTILNNVNPTVPPKTTNVYTV